METPKIEPTFIPTITGTGFLRASQIVGCRKRGIPAIVPFSKPTLWKKVREGKFPKPVQIAIGITMWRVQDVLDWIDRHGRTET